jgi:hypothetical protein
MPQAVQGAVTFTTRVLYFSSIATVSPAALAHTSIYAHVLPGQQRAAARRLGALLYGA